MVPFRLFAVLVVLTATALGVVYLRVASVRTAYRVQKLHARQAELRHELWTQQARQADLLEPERIKKLVHTESIHLTPPKLPGGAGDKPPQRPDWETD